MIERVRQRPLRLAAMLVGTMLALWVTMGVTLTLTMGRTRPAVALMVWPWGATALASQATQRVDGLVPIPAARKLAVAEASRAMAHEPGNVAAIRVLGVAAALERRPTAGAYFTTAERFSRRDLLVQLALIESAVATGDVEAAVTHYDRALRTGYRAYDLLFPILVPASADPAIAGPLSRRLAARPAWWNAFVERAIQHPAANPMLSMLVRQVRLRVDRPTERPFLVGAMQRLVAQGDIEGALLVYRDVRGSLPAAATIRDSGFERDDQLPPFEWELTDTADLAAIREPGVRPGNTRLRLVASGGRDGMLGRQLLVLAPGRYRLTALAGDGGLGGFLVRITCADSGEAVLGELAIAGPPAGRRLVGDVTVPGGCRGQWLTIAAKGVPDASGTDTGSPWIDDIVVTRFQR